MKARLFNILLLAFTIIASPDATAVGFKQFQVRDSGNPDLTVGLWYPSDAPVPTEPNTRFHMAMALDAPIHRANGGLIVISHGYGGWYAGHADTAVALAEAGYIVAAPSHSGNTGADMSSPAPKWLLDRPRHISHVIDFLLVDKLVAVHLAPTKIGVYGFSAGGYTALGLIGGVPDVNQAQQHCREQPQEWVCGEGLIDAMLGASMAELPASAWGSDSRIKAAVISAPGWGFAYSKTSLIKVTADVQLWSGTLDDSVPTATNAGLLALRLPNEPETNWVDNANHFAFLGITCSEGFKQDDPEEFEFLCTDAPGFNRQAFHKVMHSKMVRFFNESLDVGR